MGAIRRFHTLLSYHNSTLYRSAIMQELPIVFSPGTNNYDSIAAHADAVSEAAGGHSRVEDGPASVAISGPGSAAYNGGGYYYILDYILVNKIIIK